MPLLTQDNWHEHLLSPTIARIFRDHVGDLNHWCRRTGIWSVPFTRITWWSNGSCCVHAVYSCEVCARQLGYQTAENTSAAEPPPEASFQNGCFWGPFMRRWSEGTVAEEQRKQRGHPSPQGWRARRRESLVHRDISLPVYYNPTSHAHPEILPDEVYIFPVSSTRVLIENDVTGTKQLVRLPDMSVRDLALRLLDLGHGRLQQLWLRWARERGGPVRWKRMSLGAGCVSGELERGADGERITAGMEKAIVICGV